MTDIQKNSNRAVRLVKSLGSGDNVLHPNFGGHFFGGYLKYPDTTTALNQEHIGECACHQKGQLSDQNKEGGSQKEAEDWQED